MSDFSLQEQAKRYLDGVLTLHQLHMYVNDHVVRDFQYGEPDAAANSLADFLVGIFAEYELDRHLLGRSAATSEFRQNLSEFISQPSRTAGRAS